jgi:hypothetical protein
MMIVVCFDTQYRLAHIRSEVDTSTLGTQRLRPERNSNTEPQAEDLCSSPRRTSHLHRTSPQYSLLSGERWERHEGNARGFDPTGNDRMSVVNVTPLPIGTSSDPCS